MLKFLIIVVVAILITFIAHMTAKKNVGMSLLVFLVSLSVGILLLQPNGFERTHQPYECQTLPQNNVILPCKHSDNITADVWCETTVYTDNLSFLLSSEKTPVLIYCPRCYSVESARSFYRKHKKDFEQPTVVEVIYYFNQTSYSRILFHPIQYYWVNLLFVVQ